jgi:4-amino-4-deoxy-L-arabinose transferase-like glycosyltransferase
LSFLICTAALLATAAFAAFAFERLPHLEDEVAYLFQARTMAMGRLTVPSPAEPDSFWTPFVLDYRGQRFGKYTPGWPAMLALGARAGVPWLVNPLLAACVLYLVYRLGETFYDRRTGLIAAALGLFSPLFLVLGGSFLSHIASMVWLLLFSLWFIWSVQGRSRGFALGAGLALGMAFLIRPLTAVAWAAPFAIYALIQLARGHAAWTPYLLIAAGAAMISALLPLYQWAVTGDPLLNPYTLWWPYDRVGFGPGIGAMPGGHSPHYAWLNLKQDLTNAATDVLGWPALSWLPLVLGLALAPRRRRDWALLAPFACLVTAYLFYWIGSPSRLWGPRYYFEGFAWLWLLAAVGLVKAWDWAGARPRWVRVAGVGPGDCLRLILHRQNPIADC